MGNLPHVATAGTVTPSKIIIDCDPGLDDALALALACAAPGLEIAGITTVAGNATLERTTVNALRLRAFLGADEVPVVPGSAGALAGHGLARHNSPHGVSGLGAVALPEVCPPPAGGHAADFLAEAVRAHPGEITLLALGPLTNIALAVRAEPRLVEQVRGLVVLGGRHTRRAPVPDFNLAADPEAAAVVFGAGWTVTAIGVDVAGQARAGDAVVAEMRTLGRLGRELLVPCVEFPRRAGGPGGPAVHDACAVACVIDPGVVTTAPAAVTVVTGPGTAPGTGSGDSGGSGGGKSGGGETAAGPAPGTTVTDLRPGRPANAVVATALDADRFWELALSSYRRLAHRLG
ncbi:ribosylpyrimidine nucleosidase [Planobispora rosea]|uniref:Ribosylpyrimidine nucleosidase n=1 Tax=Planobispora rosea TaxID=35762 RepID=A0A8J3S5P4_PLARO|nr:ribosylpyrimidine nucleosidase [Planobispora rosea]GIH87225.1 ribosylpyrimidine nucleosidase [Planobispora rosea]